MAGVNCVRHANTGVVCFSSSALRVVWDDLSRAMRLQETHLYLLHCLCLLSISNAVFTFVFFAPLDTQFLYVALAVPELCSPGQSQTHRDPPVPASGGK